MKTAGLLGKEETRVLKPLHQFVSFTHFVEKIYIFIMLFTLVCFTLLVILVYSAKTQVIVSCSNWNFVLHIDVVIKQLCMLSDSNTLWWFIIDSIVAVEIYELMKVFQDVNY